MRILLALLLLTGVAAADPHPRDRFAAGGVAVGSRGGGLVAEVNVEGAWRPSPKAPLWIDALGAVGAWQREDYGDSTDALVRAGGELRGCAIRAACGFVDLELGYLRLDASLAGPLGSARAGLELGGAQVRVRISIERSIGLGGGLSHQKNPADDLDDDFEGGTGLSLAVTVGAMF